MPDWRPQIRLKDNGKWGVVHVPVPRRKVRPFKHGASAYMRQRCHCEVCVTEGRRYQRERRARLKAQNADA